MQSFYLSIDGHIILIKTKTKTGPLHIPEEIDSSLGAWSFTSSKEFDEAGVAVRFALLLLEASFTQRF